jgi:transcriptional regulator with XRE-family HTH domain
MELARPLAAEPPAQTSPLTTLRLQRKLTVEEAAKRAALWPEQVEWLEEGKLYRFPGQDTAVLALLRYATSLPWKVSIDVLNGSGDINYTRRVASSVGSFGYRIQHVTRASRFDYKETSVYFEPGGAGLAQRLAAQLGGVPVHPLPGGTNKRRLVVIVGPAHATG